MSALLALAPPAPTSPARGTLRLGADSPAPARWLQTRGHARRSGSRGIRGRRRARKAPASSRPPLTVRVEVGGTRAPAQQSRAAVAASLFYPNELRSVSETGPKKSRKSCLPPGERSPPSLCLESQHPRLQCAPERFPAGLPPSLTLQHRVPGGPASAGEPRTPGPKP